jgi:DNA-binding transcriptional ArsR family regulator
MRLRLVSRLCEEGPLSIARLAEGSGVTRQAVTKHLQVMQNAKLVRGCRRGRETVWQMEQKRLTEARRYLKAISRQWEDALSRLQELVES